MSHKSLEIKVNASFLRGMGNPAAIAGKEKSLQNSLENSYSFQNGPEIFPLRMRKSPGVES